MSSVETHIKVKDTSIVGYIIVAFCVSPLVFMLLYYFWANYVIGLLGTVLIYSVALIYLVNLLKRSETEYALIADQDSIFFKKQGRFSWSEIKSIEFGTRLFLKPRRFIVIRLQKGNQFEIDADAFDVSLEELEVKLNSLRSDFVSTVRSQVN